MIELYGSPTPSAATIAIMLEEIGFAYSIFPVTKDNSEQLELEFLKSTPNNVFPIILDRDGPESKPLVIFEAGAILLYLAEKSGQLIPSKSTERLDVLQWLLFENSKIGPTLGNTKHFMYHAPENIPYAVKRFNNEAKRIFNIIENQLGENEFLAGEYSVADIASFPWVKEYERYSITQDEIPNITAWLSKIQMRKAVTKGLEALSNLKD
jgi:GSH-dependent disulfide-bond oxidoreductase